MAPAVDSGAAPPQRMAGAGAGADAADDDGAPAGGSGGDDDGYQHCLPPLRRCSEALRGDAATRRRTAYASAACFLAYCSVYGLRSPWRAAGFEGESDILGVEYKDALAIAWTLAYFVGKVVSTPVLGGLSRRHRVPLTVVCAAAASAPLVAFAVVRSPPARLVLMALNAPGTAFFFCGFYRYVEGRSHAELLGAALSAAIIVGSGVAKAVGQGLLDAGVAEAAMPAAAAAAYVPFVAVFVLLVDAIPAATRDERARQGARRPMPRQEQYAFVRRHWPLLCCSFLCDMVMTALRDFRDMFLADMWREHYGRDMPSSLFAATEIAVSLLVLASLAAVSRVKENRRAFFVICAVMTVGCAVTAAAQLLSGPLLRAGEGGGAAWAVASGAGIYAAFVPLSTMFYDRLVAALGEGGTAVFVISLDSVCAYAGSVGLLLYRNYGARGQRRLDFFTTAATWGAAVVAVALAACAALLRRRAPRRAASAAAERLPLVALAGPAAAGPPCGGAASTEAVELPALAGAPGGAPARL